LHPHEDRFGLQRDDAVGSRKIRAGDGKRAGNGNGRDAAEFKRMKFYEEMLFIQTLEASQPWSGCG
jgi:ribosomal protein L15